MRVSVGAQLTAGQDKGTATKLAHHYPVEYYLLEDLYYLHVSTYF
jgi:hypothetical protein